MKSRTYGRLTFGVVLAASVGGGAVVADADSNDAVCDTRDVVVKANSAPVMPEADMAAPKLFTATDGEFFTCSAVEVGKAHSECGAEASQDWIVLSDFDRFDAYVPSSCVTDVYF